MRYWFYAWRNVGRNKSRTIGSIVTLSLALALTFFLFGFISGLEADVKHNITRYTSGDISIKSKAYFDNIVFSPSHLVVPFARELVDLVSGIEGTQNFATARLDVPSSLYLNQEFVPIVARGMHFEREERFQEISELVTKGRLPRMHTREVAIGSAVARDHGLEVGSSLTFFSTTARFTSAAITLTITGVIQYPMSNFNSMAYIPIDILQEHFLAPDSATEIVVQLEKNANTTPSKEQVALIRSVAQDFINDAITHVSQAERERVLPISYASNTDMTLALAVQPWQTISSFVAIISYSRVTYLIISFIFFLLGSLVMYNAINMNIKEQEAEIGILNAIGVSPRMIQKIFLRENMIIVGIGALVGTLLGSLIVEITGRIGLDMSFKSIDSGGSVLGSIIYPQHSVLWTSVLVIYAVIVISGVTYFPLRGLRKVDALEILRKA